MNSLRTSVVLAVVIGFAILSGTAVADPLFGQVLKFEQLPLNGGLAPSVGGAPFPGHDELSTANLHSSGIFYVGTYMADDFSDNFSTPVVHVQWWGSYLNTAQPSGGVQKFLISFETDVPAVPGTVSHPGDPILSQIVNLSATLSPGSGTFTELAIGTPLGAPEQLYQYNAELALPFHQFADHIYWLKIVALVDTQHEGPLQWGWHNRDYTIQDTLASPVPSPGEHMVANGLGMPIWHFQDNAVTGAVAVIPLPAIGTIVAQDGFVAHNYVDGLDGPTGIGEFSKDLAFRLYTTPEPSTLVLLGMGSLALALVIRRRRRG
jgi:hypothetical protein